MTSSPVSAALDEMFQRPQGLYGSFEDIPVVSQAGHVRRVELLDRLKVGDTSGMTCVDFGMGSWGFGAVFPRMHDCARAIGMDLSAAAIEMSRELVATSQPKYAERFETYQSDGMDIPMPDGSVDLFFSGESIEHVKFPPRFLSEIYRVLRVGGQLVITTPNRDAIRYKEQNEEYCTSPEHFWLFNTLELVDAVSEFFDIEEIYGFNGSFGSHEEDREIQDSEQARIWSRQFEHEPGKATGIILRATRRPNVDRRYEIEDVPSSGFAIEGADTYLPLEFGLKGLLLDNQAARVSFVRPPSDGVVCRLWSHRWSGEANIISRGVSDSLDLYTKVPGWKNWVSATPTTYPTTVEISPAMQCNPKSEAKQVIFFEAFTWRTLTNDGAVARSSVNPARVLPLWRQSSAPKGYGFARFQRFVGTTVFHWFTRTEGNVRGPWQPVGGRQMWDGTVLFWRLQIKEMMMANIDAIYLHLIPNFEESRINFFKAYAELRAEGWDVPKVAPFLDPFGIWREASIDLATADGKDAFVSHYIRFFEQYLAENQDDAAASYLLTVDGKVVLTTWWVSLLSNVTLLTREEVEARLRQALGDRIPQLAAGIWVMTTALVDPDLTFADERMIMFSGYAYAIHSVHAGIDVWHVQAGYWDQNIRSPGYLLPRDGGKNYRRAWDIVASNMPHVVRVYVASWNEYDEGSGIYAADPKGLFVDPAIHSNTDVFSDTDDPYEYVLTTAVGAARINGRPEDDAKFIWHEVSGAAVGGRQIVIRLVVRNEGNQRWTTQERYAVFVLDGEKIVREFPIDDRYGASVAPQYGIVRGEPVALEISLDIPEGEGRHELTLSVGRAGIPFGERLILPIKFDASVGLPVVSATGNADASSVDQLRADVASVSWFHQIDLGNGIVTPGIDETLFKLPKMHIPDRLDGKSVIDIGAWNGAFSFECERRGARRVVAADWNCWQLGNKRGFDIAKRALNSRVEEKEIRVEDLSEEMVGTFDLVLFLGVLYHAPDPLGYLPRVRAVCRGMAIVETLVDANDYGRPALVFYEGASMNNDVTNFFGPNQMACEAMMREAGFRDVQMVDGFYGNRMVFHGFV